MWRPRLKYHLRGPGDVTRWTCLYPGPSLAGAREASLCCCHLGLLSLVATLHLVGVTWRGYASLCTDLQIVAVM
jgi:hypothetical protein